MTYPSDPALNASQAQYPDLWDGLLFAYLPGYAASTAIVGGDVLSHTGTTSIQTFPDGPARQYSKIARSVGENAHWNGLGQFTQIAYFDLISQPTDTSDNGVFGNSTSIAGFNNCAQFVIRRFSTPDADHMAPRFLLRSGGTETAATYTTPTPTGNNLWIGGRNATNHPWIKVKTRSKVTGSTAVSGALSGHSTPIVSSYYDPTSENRGTAIALYYSALWSRTLSDTEIALLEDDPYAPFRKAEGSGPVGVLTIGSITKTHDTALVPWSYDETDHTGVEYRLRVAEGTWGGWINAGLITPIPLSGLSSETSYEIEVRAYNAFGAGAADADTFTTNVTPSFSTITVTQPLKNNAGTPLADQSAIKVAVLSASTLESVHDASALTTNGSGLLQAVADVPVAPGAAYHVVIKLADGSVGVTGPITAS